MNLILYIYTLCYIKTSCKYHLNVNYLLITRMITSKYVLFHILWVLPMCPLYLQHFLPVAPHFCQVWLPAGIVGTQNKKHLHSLSEWINLFIDNLIYARHCDWCSVNKTCLVTTMKSRVQ